MKSGQYFVLKDQVRLYNGGLSSAEVTSRRMEG